MIVTIKELRREYKRQYYLNNREQILQKRKEHYSKNKDTINRKRKEAYYVDVDGARKKDFERRVRIKKEVLTYYGHGKCACIKCGYDDIRALSIDHIEGGGNIHRKETKIIGGCYFYRRLKLDGFPSDYQTLCMNCQMVKKAENRETGTRFLEDLYHDSSY